MNPTQQNIVPATDERRWQFIRHADIYGAIGNKWVLELDARIDAEVEEKKRLEQKLKTIVKFTDLLAANPDIVRVVSIAQLKKDWSAPPDPAQPAEQKMCSHSHIDRDGTCQICGKFLPASNVNLANENTPPAEVPEWMVSAGKMIVQKLAINVPSLLVDAKVVDEFVACIFAHAPRPSASAVEGAEQLAKELAGQIYLSEYQPVTLSSTTAKFKDIILKHIAPSPESEAVNRLVEAAKHARDWLNKHSLMAGGILRELCEALPKQDGGSNV